MADEGRSRVWLRRAALPLALTLAPLASAGCDGIDAPAAVAAAQEGPAPALPDSTFARLVDALSGEPGYFDTDNLISNETSYLHPLGVLRERGVRGGAYVGVGPDQNFSYIATVRPRIAFIVDIRRDNLLQHLLFKALFEAASSRVEYLSLLLGRPLPDDPAAFDEAEVDVLVAAVDRASPDSASVARARTLVDSAVVGFGVPLDADDLATIRRFHEAFIGGGLDLRFHTFGRAPRPYYPTLRQLLLERDLTGARASYLADREAWLVVRELQRRNLVVPVVGDLAGEHALRAIGDLLRERGEVVTALYASNVEFYLFRSGTFGRFAANVRALPVASGGVLIRSHFPNFRGPHPHRVEGYWSTQTLQTLGSFVEATDGEGYRDYQDLVTRDAIDPRPGGGR